MTNIIKTVYDLTTTAVQAGRNYAEIDGIRLVFEDGRLEGWYNPGKPEDDEQSNTVPSEDVSC